MMEHNLQLGRDESSQVNLGSPLTRRALQLPENLSENLLNTVGRRHLLITVQEKEPPEEDRILIEEPAEGSTNGTTINGRRIARFVLRPGLSIGIGALQCSSDALIQEIKKQAYKNQQDFSRQFSALEPVLQEKTKAIEKIDLKNGLRTFGPPVLAGLVCAAFKLYSIAIIISAGLSMISRVFIFKESRIRAEKERLDAHYQDKLRCPRPACNKPLNRTLEFYRQHKRCETCKAIYYN
jgi:hypothetical protein